MSSPTVRKHNSVSKTDATDSAADKASPHERRIQPRFTAQFRSTFSGTHEEGQGRTVDLSIGGCKIESEMLVTVGNTLECRLHAPGLDWPLRIDQSTVRWVNGKHFGLAFLRIRPEELTKLKSVLAQFDEA